jgi:hypothetical protein
MGKDPSIGNMRLGGHIGSIATECPGVAGADGSGMSGDGLVSAGVSGCVGGGT